MKEEHILRVHPLIGKLFNKLPAKYRKGKSHSFYFNKHGLFIAIRRNHLPFAVWFYADKQELWKLIKFQLGVDK